MHRLDGEGDGKIQACVVTRCQYILLTPKIGNFSVPRQTNATNFVCRVKYKAWLADQFLKDCGSRDRYFNFVWSKFVH